jgi:serine/threonine protein kinase
MSIFQIFRSSFNSSLASQLRNIFQRQVRPSFLTSPISLPLLSLITSVPLLATDDRSQLLHVAELVGTAVGKIHEADIVHGDLTTSNLMLTPAVAADSGGATDEPSDSHQIVIIDFGLGMTRPVIEDKAVDLYVLERALVSTHPGSEYLVRLSSLSPLSPSLSLSVSLLVSLIR